MLLNLGIFHFCKQDTNRRLMHEKVPANYDDSNCDVYTVYTHMLIIYNIVVFSMLFFCLVKTFHVNAICF